MAVLSIALAWSLHASTAEAAGTVMFSTTTASTGEKPQSKLFYHDGSYWGVLRGPDGLAIYEKVGTNWVRGAAADNVLAGGQADVKWNGSTLYVLAYTSTTRLYEFTYNSAQRLWVRSSGFPVTVPVPSGSETMVLDQDSTGRLWTTAEGGGNINVYYSTTADHRTWSTTPIVLQSGVSTDDISSVVAFGGNKIGVFWSDQNRDEFGFRTHNDAEAPEVWSSIEIADSGSGHADDHIHLAFDTSGRVYAITKDDSDKMRVHRRSTSGSWTTKTDVLGGTATRGIIMVAEADSKVYVLYTRWGVSPERIEYRVADLSTLSFGGETVFISSSSDMNNVTGMKQILPAGCLIAAAEGGGQCYYNSFGNPPGGASQPPGPPQNLVATLAADNSHVDLAWSAPATGTPDGYNVYRQLNGGALAQLNGGLVTSRTYTDSSLPPGELCYVVRAVKSGLESTASNTACVTVPEAPPGPPLDLTARLLDPAATTALLSLPFDEGSGQQASDVSGNGNHARLGATTGAESSDPLWVTGQSGTALQFDGSNDFLEAADSPSLDPSGSFTIEAWVQRTGTATMAIVSKGPSGARTYRLRILSGGTVEFRWEIAGGTGREIAVPALFIDKAWHHLACVYDQAAGQNRVYFDGVLRGTGAASGVPATNASTLLVGAYLSGTSRAGFFKGAIDGLCILPQAQYTDDFTPPAVLPVPMLAATAADGDAIASQYVQLAWRPPATGGAAIGYNVYRAVNGGPFVRLSTALVTATTFRDPNLDSGQHAYTVRAVNSGLTEGTASNQASVYLGPPPPEPPQDGVVALQGTDPESAIIQWTAASSGTPAVGFNVYRTVNGGTAVKLNAALVTGSAFTDSVLPGGTHCYQVAGVDSLAREGTRSAAACVDYTPPPPPAPTQPLFLTVSLGTSSGGPVPGVAAYAFDEGSGQLFADATGNGHSGQLGSASGVDTADPAWTSGASGSALRFDGANDRGLVPDAALLDIAGSFTVEAWVQRAATGVTHCVLNKGDSQRRNYCVSLTSTGAIDFFWETAGGTNHGTTSGVAISDASWHHVACVYDLAAGQNRIYVDGALLHSAADSGTPVTNADPLHIGAYLSSSLKYFFNGSIDQVRVSAGAIYSAPFVPATAFEGGLPVTTAQLSWQPPASGTPAGYSIYRQVDGGPFAKLNGSLVTGTSYDDVAPPAGALCYQVTAVDAVPQEGPASDPACTGGLSAKASPDKLVSELPMAPFLGASPNPFNPATTIVFRLPVATRVELTIFDVRGRRVAALLREERAAGEHRIRWDGRADDGSRAASGTYFLVLDAGDVHLRKKAVLVK